MNHPVFGTCHKQTQIRTSEDQAENWPALWCCGRSSWALCRIRSANFFLQDSLDVLKSWTWTAVSLKQRCKRKLFSPVQLFHCIQQCCSRMLFLWLNECYVCLSRKAIIDWQAYSWLVVRLRRPLPSQMRFVVIFCQLEFCCRLLLCTAAMQQDT